MWEGEVELIEVLKRVDGWRRVEGDISNLYSETGLRMDGRTHRQADRQVDRQTN